ncbi:MAG: DUF1330 domain-containing protein [Devosiaceae bacterium]|nr:DUF1330 domain-containing protein [Devosiaceae bacterium]
MKAYAMFQETVFDEMRFESYKQVSSVTIKNHGGVFLARGGKFKVLEGETRIPGLLLYNFRVGRMR